MADAQHTSFGNNHIPVEHASGECPQRERGLSCMFCDGGLSACEVCGGFEGAMPSDCPGEPMTYARGQEVYRGEIDFRDGNWVMDASSKYSPVSYRKYHV